MIFERVMGILENPRWPPKIFKIVNICTIINIFDTHEEQKLFFIKKYTFIQNFIDIEQIITKLCPLENGQKVKKCVFSCFFRDKCFQWIFIRCGKEQKGAKLSNGATCQIPCICIGL